MTLTRLIVGCIIAMFLAAAAFLALAWRPSIAAIEPPSRTAFDPALIEKGAALAAIGNCNTCHTTQDDAAYAGGRPIPTPFGTIYATNITPERDTGIGQWSEAAFIRAMRQGVDRDGAHLYPAFPYDHFSRTREDDLRALYAFVMTRDPIKAETPGNDLPFPLNVRLVLAGWKLLFLRGGEFEPVADRDAQWNRGAYLVESLAHCGACHTPRNILGAENTNRAFDGGSIEGWDALALNENSPAPIAWTADRLFNYLRHGFDEQHGAAKGPMAPVTYNLADAPENDVRAIAVYIASIAARPDAARESKAKEAANNIRPTLAATSGTAPPSDQPHSSGAAIYAGGCAVCHDNRLPQFSQGIPLALSSSISAPSPRNAIRAVLDGIHPADGTAGPFMPAFGAALTDAQVAGLVRYLRTTFSAQPAWQDVEGEVRRAREGAS